MGFRVLILHQTQKVFQLLFFCTPQLNPNLYVFIYFIIYWIFSTFLLNEEPVEPDTLPSLTLLLKKKKKKKLFQEALPLHYIKYRKHYNFIYTRTVNNFTLPCYFLLLKIHVNNLKFWMQINKIERCCYRGQHSLQDIKSLKKII